MKMNAVLRAQKAQPGTVREKTKRLGALQRALDTPAPSAALVFGDVLAHLALLRARAPGEAGVPVHWRVDRHSEVCIESGVAIFDADSLCAYCAAKGFAAQRPAAAGMQRPAAGVGFDALFRISDAPLVVCGELCFRFDLAAGGLLGHINPTSEDPTRILKSRSPHLSGAVSLVACPLKRCLLARAEQEGGGLGELLGFWKLVGVQLLLALGGPVSVISVVQELPTGAPRAAFSAPSADPTPGWQSVSVSANLEILRVDRCCGSGGAGETLHRLELVQVAERGQQGSMVWEGKGWGVDGFFWLAASLVRDMGGGDDHGGDKAPEVRRYV
jgi:hypothetical protein